MLNQAQSLAVQYRHQQIDVAHVFSALLQQERGTPSEILRKLGVDPELVQRRVESLLSSFLKSERATTQLYPTPEFLELGANADAEATRLKDDYIAAEHILIAFTKIEKGAIPEILRDFGIDQDSVYRAMQEVRGSHRVTDPRAESKYQALERYSRDLTEMAREGKLDPVVGRDEEIRRVVQVLTRRTKNNPVLIGEAGVGKTAVAEGLAQRIASDDVPDSWKGRRVLALDRGAL
ncbi:MAG: ATP-dependent Clp protease ATP-binding subunit, partial [Chloroflexi bacterium]|nr:ATP-dependent Clp protease ATP-binding subunit [Chloroflexota bacterium]